VVDILSWRKKKVPEAGAVLTEAEKTESVSQPSPGVSVSALGQMSVAEFEQALTRIEVAKKVVEVREQHAGMNRNRVKRLFRGIGLAALVGALFAFLSPSGPKEKLPIDKVAAAGVLLPVVGALPGASKTGHIAIIKISGGIGGTLHGPSVASNTPLYLDTALKTAEEDPDLAGVIIEIDSPGGGVSASEQSYRIVKAARERLAKRKVKLIAYTSVGAYSGGYYIAMGAGQGNFYADPGASVANIGVIMTMLNTSALGEKFGITETIVKSGPLKSTGSQWEKLTPEQRTMLQESIDDSFKLFLEAVSESRGIDMPTLVRESQLPVGRTNGGWFSARRALDKKLIDGIIPVEDLYKLQASALPDQQKFKNVEFVDYRARLGVFEQLTMETGRISGIFMRNLFSEMTHRDQPVRSERE